MKRIYFFLIMIVSFISLLTLFLPASWCATYYIDYQNGLDSNDGLSKTSPWKRCPGMKGFNGNFTHSDCAPWVVLNNNMTYTADESWYAESNPQWSHPIFDGGGVINRKNNQTYVYSQDKSSITFNKLKFQNIGVSGKPMSNHSYGMKILAMKNWTLSNCIFDTLSYTGITFLHYADRQGMGNVTIRNCEFSRMSNAITFNGSTNKTHGNAFQNLYIYNNKFHDQGVMCAEGDHCDGVHLYAFQYDINNLEFYNNIFYGDYQARDPESGFTSQFYIGEGVEGAKIYNNVFCFSNKTTPTKGGMITSPGTIYVFLAKDIKIYNNTVVSDALPEGFASGIAVRDSSGVDIKNNIISNAYKGIWILNDPGHKTTYSSDYNLFYTGSSGFVAAIDAEKKTLFSWQALQNDINGKLAKPRFSDSPSDLRLQADSPAIGAAFDLGASFKTDIRGVIRPTGKWDMGAYQRSVIHLSPGKN
jgi:hypothetical protein